MGDIMKKIKTGKIITVTSMKGGVGKTNLVFMLAALLFKLNKKILLIDLDLYTGDISFSLNLKPKGTIFNLCDDINNNRYKFDKESLYITKYNEYIDVLCAPKDPRQASKINPSYIELILNNMKNRYDVILVDTTHVLNPYNMMAFNMSDKILEIFTNDALDIKSTKSFISICKNMGTNKVITVLNNALDYRRNYFSLYDIKSVIGKNTDFIIPSNLYIKRIDSYIMDGTLFDIYVNKKDKDYGKFFSVINALLEDKEEKDEK